MNNLEASTELCRRLISLGVREFCLCAGSRNSPLVALLCAVHEGLNIYSFADERAAAFFALGRARRSGHPVAVVTTSGTAAAECLPAVVEAHYTGVPLLVVTADRPRRFRGTGAPQCIEQVGLFGVYVESCVDFEAKEGVPELAWSRRRPLHLNIGFDEPLLDGPVASFLVGKRGAEPSASVLSNSETPEVTARKTRQLEEAVASWKRPLVLIGALSASEREAARAFALRLGAPVYAEALSGLREDAALDPLLLKSGERILARGNFDGVLRIGGVPTLRFWRDLEDRLRDVPVVNVSSLSFAGLSRGLHLQVSVADILSAAQVSARAPSELLELDRSFAPRLLELLFAEPTAELSMIHFLSRMIPERAHVFLGNSLPIREWDLAAARRARKIECTANRGANGIDGELASFLGLSEVGRDNWALLGDLTTLYDLSAPWVVPQMPDVSFQIVVINNGGGRIFGRVPSLKSVAESARERYFENRHAVRFDGWAQMWNLGYEEWTRVPPHLPASTRGVIELRPDADASARLWQRYDELWSEK